nr:hypothetical protein [uncultured Rhodoferax sp.]
MSETLQLLEKLNSFYAGAFAQLVTYTVGVLAFIGILIPFGIAAFQNRQMKRDQNSLSNQIASELTEARIQLTKEFEEQFAARETKLQEQLKAMKQEIAKEVEKIDDLAMARSLHLQAAANLNTRPGSSTFDCLSAIPQYGASSDERNLIAILRLLESSLPLTTLEDFNLYEIDEVGEDAIKYLQKLNQHGRYAQEISLLKRSLAEAKVRKPDELAKSS